MCPLARRVALAIVLAPVAVIHACWATPPGEEMANLLRRYQTDRSDLQRFYNIRLSGQRSERLQRFSREWLDRLQGIAFDNLDADSRIDYLLLRNHLEGELRGLTHALERREEILPLLPFASTIIDLEESRWRTLSIDSREVAERLAKLAEAIDGLREAEAKRLKKTDEDAEAPIKPTVARRAARSLSRLRSTLREWFQNQDGYQPEFSWWVKSPYEEAGKALERYADFLMKKVAGIKGEDDDPLIGDPIGREALIDALTEEMIPYGPEEMLEIARREFAWCEERMLEASRELGLGEDWRAALEQVKELHQPPGKQVELVARQAREAIAFLDERDLVTIPELCRDTWRFSMISERGQKTLPFAAYGGQRMMVAYPTQGMTHESKRMSMRGNNIHFSRIVTPHELVPGHHLQRFVAARHNTHRSAFGTPFLVEGWALYWELLLWKLGYPRGPEDRIGMLFWRMHRCARIIVSLKFHLAEMTPDEMIDFLVDRVGHERDGATSEVRRYIGGGYGPLYQCAYMVGGLQLMALRGELVESGRMTDRQFHDAVLREGSIPIELIRARLLGIALERDHSTGWKFAGEVPPRKRRIERF
ncbi:MAG: DUF885 domain-containing protein [Planctomycetota bacterium]